MFESVIHDFLEVVTSGWALRGARVIVLSSAGPLLTGGGAAAGEAGLRGDRLEGGGLRPVVEHSFRLASCSNSARTTVGVMI